MRLKRSFDFGAIFKAAADAQGRNQSEAAVMAASNDRCPSPTDTVASTAPAPNISTGIYKRQNERQSSFLPPPRRPRGRGAPMARCRGPGCRAGWRRSARAAPRRGQVELDATKHWGDQGQRQAGPASERCFSGNDQAEGCGASQLFERAVAVVVGEQPERLTAWVAKQGGHPTEHQGQLAQQIPAPADAEQAEATMTKNSAETMSAWQPRRVSRGTADDGALHSQLSRNLRTVPAGMATNWCVVITVRPPRCRWPEIMPAKPVDSGHVEEATRARRAP